MSRGAAERKQIFAAGGTELFTGTAQFDVAAAAILPSPLVFVRRHGFSDDVVVELFGLLQLGWRGFWRGRQRLRR